MWCKQERVGEGTCVARRAVLSIHLPEGQFLLFDHPQGDYVEVHNGKVAA